MKTENDMSVRQIAEQCWQEEIDTQLPTMSHFLTVESCQAARKEIGVRIIQRHMERALAESNAALVAENERLDSRVKELRDDLSNLRAGYAKSVADEILKESENAALKQQLDAAKAAAAREERDHEATIRERDFWEESFDKLMDVCGASSGHQYEWSSHFGVPEALILADETIEARIQQAVATANAQIARLSEAARTVFKTLKHVISCEQELTMAEEMDALEAALELVPESRAAQLSDASVDRTHTESVLEQLNRAQAFAGSPKARKLYKDAYEVIRAQLPDAKFTAAAEKVFVERSDLMGRLASDERVKAAVEAYQLPWNDTVEWLLGQPGFAVRNIAFDLQKAGLYPEKKKTEHEQAIVAHWALNLYLKHGDKWCEVARSFFNAHPAPSVNARGTSVAPTASKEGSVMAQMFEHQREIARQAGITPEMAAEAGRRLAQKPASQSTEEKQ